MDIKPRIDEDGVGWCDPVQCPEAVLHDECSILGVGLCDTEGSVCPVWARRMAVENEAWRSWRITISSDMPAEREYWVNLSAGRERNWVKFLTITEAVDALINEEDV